MLHERRRVPRYRLDAEIAVNDGQGRTVDVSASGVYFTSAVAFTPGDQVDLVFPFEYVSRGTSVHLSAQVVRVDRRDDGFGIAATYEPVEFNVSA